MLSITLALAASLPPVASLQAPDSDLDGLSDAHETHKYGTDPKSGDSDGDGVPDGDWGERREYAYTVRSVVQVMRPVTVEFLDDDFQDVRVLDETADYVELEVIHYPFSKMAEAAGADLGDAERARWLEPGPTSNATPELGRGIRDAMKQDGVELEDLRSRVTVVAAARWLVQRAGYDSGFTIFVTAFDERGNPFVPDRFRANAERNAAERGRSIEEQWQREVFAAGMFEAQTRGSCTSSAIYLSGCLRALGIPTRTVLCIPIIDASDEDEWRLVKLGISHHRVRSAIEVALGDAPGAWRSHTFNEVFVEGRWRRLNYAHLDQGILDEQFLGLMTHIATFHDWADARFWETIGRRQKSDAGEDVFGHRNPYSTISLRDQFGVHCRLENPPVPVPTLAVTALHWSDADELPSDVRSWSLRHLRFGLVAEIVAPSADALKSFLARADRRLRLHRSGSPPIDVSLDAGCWWFKRDRAFVFVPFGQPEIDLLMRGVTYQAVAFNDSARATLDLELTVKRD